MQITPNQQGNNMSLQRTAEFVGQGHPDKATDQIADAILDEALSKTPNELKSSVRTAIEGSVKDNIAFITGETKLPEGITLDIESIVKRVWSDIRYPHADLVTVIDQIKPQSSDIAKGTDSLGAGDQGIMVGYCCSDNNEGILRS